MAFKNFKVETDADGIVLVTWDTPGRSMNVLDETSINELEAIVKQTSADAAVKGVVITSGKEALCAGADLSMLEGMSRQYAEMLKAKGEVAANQMLFDQSRRFSQVFRAHRDLRQAMGRRDQRARARRRLRTDAVLPLPRRRRTIRRPVSGCPRSRSGCSPAPAAPSACRASCRRRMRCSCC